VHVATVSHGIPISAADHKPLYNDNGSIDARKPRDLPHGFIEISVIRSECDRRWTAFSSLHQRLQMIEYYPWFKSAHIGLVLASGSLFAARGALALAGKSIAGHPLLRYSSYTIDTALLGAAFVLMSIVHMYPLSHDWLTLKIALLLVYVVLGSFALKRARTARVRVVCYLAALLVYLVMFGIARAHHPLGWLRWWGVA
jgi:uncharacterized membrane protein SirB2